MVIFLKSLTIKHPCKPIGKYVWMWKWLHHELLETHFMWNKGLLFSFPSLVCFFSPLHPHSFHGCKNIIFPCFQHWPCQTLGKPRGSPPRCLCLSFSGPSLSETRESQWFHYLKETEKIIRSGPRCLQTRIKYKGSRELEEKREI